MDVGEVALQIKLTGSDPNERILPLLQERGKMPPSSINIKGQDHVPAGIRQRVALNPKITWWALLREAGRPADDAGPPQYKRAFSRFDR